MNDPIPGLRPLFNKSNSAQRVELIIAAGAEICVPAEVAAQLPVEFVPVVDTTKADQAAERAEAALLSLDEARAIEAADTELVAEPAKVKTAKRGKK